MQQLLSKHLDCRGNNIATPAGAMSSTNLRISLPKSMQVDGGLV